MKRRLLLLGWDAADWETLHPLLDDGEMPALNRLVEAGACGALHDEQPAVPALRWTSLATGKFAWQHGIGHDREILRDNTWVPITAAHCRSLPVWEILARHGRRALAAGWPATHGGRTPQAQIVSDRFAAPTAPPGVNPWPAAIPGTYWPENLGDKLNRCRVNPAEVAADIVGRYLPRWREIDQKQDSRLGQLRVLLASDFSYHAAMVELMGNADWDFAAVRFSALDAIRQIFPTDPGPVKAHCRMLDRMLGNLIHLAGGAAAVMVVSHKIFIAQGMDWGRDTLVHGVRLVDVAPAILSWCGLSPETQEEGVENIGPLAGDDPTTLWRREMAWNLAQSALAAGRWAEALRHLDGLFRAFPERADFADALFFCQRSLGRWTEAEETLEVVLENVPPGASSLLTRAEWAWSKRDVRVARSLANQIWELAPTGLDELRRLGILLLHLRDWITLAKLAHLALQVDDTNPLAWLALAEAELGQRHAAEAVAAAERAIGLKYFLPEAHFVLARGWLVLGKWTQAREALGALLKLQPNHRMAPAYFRRMPGGTPST